MFFSTEERERLLANGRASRESNGTIDHVPVVKLFTPDNSCTWLISELSPDDETIAFGLCDLGIGFPELGYVSISELAAVRGRLGLPVEKDISFRPDKSLSQYALDARTHKRIVT